MRDFQRMLAYYRDALGLPLVGPSREYACRGEGQTVRAEVDPEEFTPELTSEPFSVPGYKRIAVNVVALFGIESTIVRDLAT